MRILSRLPTNKKRSAKTFKRNSKTTKSANLAPPPHRGGYRL